MPVRNEATHIAAGLQSVLDQTFDAARTEIVVVDGESEDGTVEIARAVLHGRANSRVIHNPGRSIPSGMNAGLAGATADVIVRVDGHSRLAPNYVQRCVELLSESRAANVGGLMRPRGDGVIGRAMALALSSKFGIGDSRFHYLERREYVDTVYLGAFRREALEGVGGYDEWLLANEDFELNHRIREAGFGVLLSPEIRSTYIPRASLRSIASQFYNYGRWKAQVMRKHPSSVRPRHLAAPALVATLSVCLPGFALTRKRWLLLPAGLYLTATILGAAFSARPKRLTPALMLVFPAIHLSWGTGVLSGLLRAPQLPSHVIERPAPTSLHDAREGTV
jgi:glycosyltransferase involved in cell wall biosynthesis